MADPTVAAETCVALGALTVTPMLPVKGRRLVGPWCFLDRFGPLTFKDPSPWTLARILTSAFRR
jgi:hypothetical protein